MKRLSMMLLLFVMPVLIIISTSRQVGAFSVEYLNYETSSWFPDLEQPVMYVPNWSASYDVTNDALGAYAHQVIYTKDVGGLPVSQFTGSVDQRASVTVYYELTIDEQDSIIWVNANHHGDLSWQGGTGLAWAYDGSFFQVDIYDDYEFACVMGSKAYGWSNSGWLAGAGLFRYRSESWGYEQIGSFVDSDYRGGQYGLEVWYGVELEPGVYTLSADLSVVAAVGGMRPDIHSIEAWAESDATNTGSMGVFSELPEGAFSLGTVGMRAVVPIPGAVWLLGSGLIGIVGIRRKFKKT